jgi:hypothetical protein
MRRRNVAAAPCAADAAALRAALAQGAQEHFKKVENSR